MVRERFPLVESTRAIAALSIVGFHGLWLFNFHYRSGPVSDLLNQLNVGVPVFFAISGLLLYKPFLTARLQGARLGVGAYAWRRALRILPGAWVALAIATVVLALAAVEHRPFLYFGWGTLFDPKALDGAIGHYWTLCVEITFYAFLPLWAWARRRRPQTLRSELSALLALYLVSVGWQAYAHLHPDPVAALRPLTVWLLPFVDQFAVGMAVAVLVTHGAIPARVERLLPFGWAVAAAALVVAAFAIGPAADAVGDALGLSTAGTNTISALARHQAQALMALGVLAPAVAGSGGGVRRLLGLRPVLWLGTISYGIYLYHLPVMTFLIRRHVQPTDLLAWWPATLALTIGLAAWSWYLVESPALRLKRLAPRWRPSPRRVPNEAA